MNIIVSVIAGIALGALVVYLIYRSSMKKKGSGLIRQAEEEAERIRENARRENERKLKEREEELINSQRLRQSAQDKKENELSSKAQEIELKIRDFEQSRRDVENGRRDVERKEKLLKMKEEELSSKLATQKEQLQKAANMSPEEAKKIFAEIWKRLDGRPGDRVVIKPKLEGKRGEEFEEKRRLAKERVRGI